MGVPYVEHVNPPSPVTTPAPTRTPANTNNAAGANRQFVILASSVVLPGRVKTKQFVALGILLTLVATLLIMALTVYTLISKNTESPESHQDTQKMSHPDAVVNTEPPPPLRRLTTTPKNEQEAVEDEDDTTPLSSPYLRIVPRKDWQAEPPTGKIQKLETPVPYVILMHTATPECFSKIECSFHTRNLQMFQQETTGLWDIGYNFLVGGDGEAYEGRGWTKSGYHTYGYNYKSIGIAFIGTFDANGPPTHQLTACQRLIEEGVELGYISKNYTLYGLRQLQSTNNPGNALYREIRTWSHWKAKP